MTAAVDAVMRALFAPGLLASGPVRTAAAVGGGAAVVCAIVGVFTVLRGEAFAGHALADVSSAGGSLSFLLGASPLLGFLGMSALAAAGLEAAGVRRAQGRDLATGVVLGAGLGLAALFLYFDATRTSAGGAAVAVMFGSMFAIPASTAPVAAAVGLVALGATAWLYRPLLLSSVSPDLAAARGVRLGATSLAHAVVLALAVALAAVTVGAILATALLVGPAATGIRLARRPAGAFAAAAGIGLGATWAGIGLAYDSAGWTPAHPWPVSFFVVALIMAVHLAVRGRAGRPAPALPGDGGEG